VNKCHRAPLSSLSLSYPASMEHVQSVAAYMVCSSISSGLIHSTSISVTPLNLSTIVACSFGLQRAPWAKTFWISSGSRCLIPMLAETIQLYEPLLVLRHPDPPHHGCPTRPKSLWHPCELLGLVLDWLSIVLDHWTLTQFRFGKKVWST